MDASSKILDSIILILFDKTLGNLKSGLNWLPEVKIIDTRE